MVFSSMIFLWLFLPITIIGYYMIDDASIMDFRYKNLLLLAASLIFYAWGEPIYILLMLLSILVNWRVGLILDRTVNYKKAVLTIDIIFNLFILGYFKYSNFLLSWINRVFSLTIDYKEISLPIGISFFTFQILSYIIDLYRGKYKAQKNILDLALYISFFPQLIAGPIVKYKDINEQLRNRKTTLEKTGEGVRRFSYGLAKKVLVANVVAKSVDSIFSLEKTMLTGRLVWIGAILYAIQIYFDFSGYSDMAIGLGKIFGFDFQENFLYPYNAYSIQDFWRRWHISLSTWFKEYLYIPLGGNRKGKTRTLFNLLVVFFLTGLWHGAANTFIIWGLYHGFFLIIERVFLKKYLEKWKALGHVYALLVIISGWVFFRADSISYALSFLKRMVLPWKYTETSVSTWQLVNIKTITIALLAIFGSGAVQTLGKKLKITERWKNSAFEIVYCMAILVLSIASLASDTYNPFIYFRF